MNGVKTVSLFSTHLPVDEKVARFERYFKEGI